MEYSDKYFVFDKDLGRPQQPGTEAYARQNSIGRPVVELTDEQRYAFDLRGWLLIEGVPLGRRDHRCQRAYPPPA